MDTIKAIMNTINKQTVEELHQQYEDSCWWRKYQVNLPDSVSSAGKWAIEHFTITVEVATTDLLRHAFRGCPERAVQPGTYTKLVHNVDGAKHIVMSDTPAEIFDHDTVLQLLELHGGEVLIHGLGLGMVVKAALESPKVRRIDVVELDQELIDLIGPHYQDERLTIWQGNAYTFKFPDKRLWSIGWHDIWDTLNEDNFKQMKKLEARYAPSCGWQDCWGREFLELYKIARQTHSGKIKEFCSDLYRPTDN